MTTANTASFAVALPAAPAASRSTARRRSLRSILRGNSSLIVTLSLLGSSAAYCVYCVYALGSIAR